MKISEILKKIVADQELSAEEKKFLSQYQETNQNDEIAQLKQQISTLTTERDNLQRTATENAFRHGIEELARTHKCNDVDYLFFKAQSHQLDLGNETRQVVSGIAKFYKPEELIGKTLVAIVNLPPRKMMGRESCGMLLSAVHTEKGEEKLNLIMISDDIPAGAKLG